MVPVGAAVSVANVKEKRRDRASIPRSIVNIDSFYSSARAVKYVRNGVDLIANANDASVNIYSIYRYTNVFRYIYMPEGHVVGS